MQLKCPSYEDYERPAAEDTMTAELNVGPEPECDGDANGGEGAMC